MKQIELEAINKNLLVLVHAKNEAKENKQQRKRAEAKVRAIYLHSENISRTDRDAIFPLSLEAKLK